MVYIVGDKILSDIYIFYDDIISQINTQKETMKDNLEDWRFFSQFMMQPKINKYGYSCQCDDTDIIIDKRFYRHHEVIGYLLKRKGSWYQTYSKTKPTDLEFIDMFETHHKIFFEKQKHNFEMFYRNKNDNKIKCCDTVKKEFEKKVEEHNKIYNRYFERIKNHDEWYKKLPETLE